MKQRRQRAYGFGLSPRIRNPNLREALLLRGKVLEGRGRCLKGSEKPEAAKEAARVT